MKICHILPKRNIPQLAQPIEMYLAAEIMNDSDLCGILRERDTYKIVDNGCYETDSSMDIRNVYDTAVSINADEIVLPDFMFDAKRTIEAVLDAVKNLYETYGPQKRFKYMAVCQGETFDEYVSCVEIFSKIKEIDVIGVPKKFMRNSNFPQSIAAIQRGYFAKQVREIYPNKEVHLLGLSWNFIELPQCAEFVRSCDTGICSEQIKNNASVFHSWGKEQYTRDVSLTSEQLEKLKKVIPALDTYVNLPQGKPEAVDKYFTDNFNN